MRCPSVIAITDGHQGESDQRFSALGEQHEGAGCRHPGLVLRTAPLPRRRYFAGGDTAEPWRHGRVVHVQGPVERLQIGDPIRAGPGNNQRFTVTG